MSTKVRLILETLRYLKNIAIQDTLLYEYGSYTDMNSS